ncbi:MAG: OmpA family protein [Oceanococcus sp.]|nr:MAG: OmpA family protein [Oceanococcus sp.]
MKGSLVGLLAASAVFGGVAHAGEQSFDDRIYGGLMLNYIDADNAMRGLTDSKSGLRVFAGKQISPLFAVEGFASYNQFGRYGDANVIAADKKQKEGSVGVDLLAFPLRCTGSVSPFVKAGIGATYFNEDETALNLSVGGGINWKLSDKLSFRTDAAWRIQDTDNDVRNVPAASDTRALGDNQTEFVFGAGFMMPFGGSAPSVSDGCPAKKMEEPAPAPAPAAPAPAPAEPAPAPAPAAAPAPETVVIYFAFDSSELNSAAKAALDRVAANLTNRNFVVAIANGHADATGTEEYNMGLSERRAASVSNYLVSKGVGASQVRQRAYGETRPAASDDTEIGRAKNRRVEINLLRQ